MKKQIITTIVVATAVGALSFFAGMKYQTKKLTNSQNSNQQNFGQLRGQNAGGQNTRRMSANGGAGFANGEILSKDEKSITVKLRDGGSKIVFLSNTTAIGKTTEGDKEDLEIGKQVVINGTTNPDGSLTAQNIQIRPNIQNINNK
jgi:hypothetical protein